jgi:large subunit ribosomal protein L10
MNVQEKKQSIVDDLNGKLAKASAFYIADFTGLNVKRVTELRSRLRKEGIEYVVVKNTLAERALSTLDMPDIGEHFKGPTALVIGQGDAVTAAKVLADFAKENDNKPSIKGGIVDRKAVTSSEVSRLAKLPPREQLLAELAGCLESPMAQLATVLEAKLHEFVGLLEALRTERDA